MKKSSKKRIVPIINYNARSFREYELIAELQDTKMLVFHNLVAAISDSIDANKKSATIFMIDIDHSISLEKNKWKSSLQKAIDFFSQEDVQNYEMCQKCTSLIEKINSNVYQIEVNERRVQP